MKKYIAIIFTAVLICFIFPWLSFWLAYLGGWIAKVTIGTPLTHSLNTLFGTTRFTPDMIPVMAGALGWLGGFFKTYNMRSNTK